MTSAKWLAATVLLTAVCPGRAQAPANDPTAFLMWSMDRMHALKSYRAVCSWSDSFGPGNLSTEQRIVVFSTPNRFKVTTTNRNFQQTSVCNGAKVLEYSNDPRLGVMTYAAPQSIARSTSMFMRNPMFCGSLLYQFFGGAQNFAGLVNRAKGPVQFGLDISIDGQPCRTVKFYALDTYGHAEIAVGRTDGLVRRIRYDSEPLLRMMAKLAKPDKRNGSALPTSTSIETYTSIRVDTPVASAEFRARPPAGARHTDMSAAGRSEQKPPVPLGRPAPDFQVTALSGGPVRLSAMRGKVVLIDFWATWCGPCRRGLPETQRLSRELGGKGLAVMAVSDEARGTVQAFIKQNRFDFPTFLDAGSKANRAYGVQAIPTVVVVDRAGRLSAFMVGLQSPETIRAALRKAGI